MDELGRLACRCVLDLYRSVDLTASQTSSSASDDDSNAVEISSVGTLASEVTELPLIVIPCTHHSNIPIEYFTILLDLNDAINTMELSLLRIPLMDQESKILHFGVLSRLRHLRWTKRLHRSDLAAATSYLRSCTESQVIDSFHQGVFYEEMGVCLSSRYCLQKDPLVLESAIECLQKSIASVRRASPTKPLIFFIWQLAYLQFYRFEGTQDVEFLDESVRQLRQCIMLSVIDNAALAACFRLLIRELVLKFELYQNRADLDEAISIHDYLGALPKRALSPHDKDLAARGNRKIVNTDRWRTAHSSLLYLRFMDTGQYRDLQSAVENLEDVLQGVDDESAAVREEATASLVNCLMQRFRVHGRVEDLRRIEELVVYDSTPSVENIYNLGKLHIMAFSWFRYQGFIDEAVKYLLLSLADLAPRMHTSLKDGVPIETEEESTFAQAALKQLRDAGTIAHYARHSRRQGILPSESRFGHGSDWLQHTSRLHDLGRAITMQFEFSPLRDNRQMGIALTVLRLAEQLAPRNSFQRWEYLFSLGISHRVRHEVMQQETDIAEAIEMQSKAVEKLIFPNPRRIPALSCLAHSLMQSARASGDVAQYHQAVDHLERVVDAFYGFIHDRLEGAILWASLLHTNTPFPFEEEHAQLQKALEGYQKGILLLARAVWIGLSTSSRLARLHSVPKTFASDAAACAIRLAELQTDPGQRQEYLGKAVELLDEARAILWSQASQLHADLRLLSTQHSDLAAELNAVAHELARTAFKDGNADSGRTTEGLAYKWESLVERVRELDGFHDFLRSIPFAELRQAAGSTSIIIVNVSEHRCDALIIPPEGPVRLVPLPRLSKSQVEDDVQDIHNMLPSYEDRGEFETVLNNLWLDVCKPILAELRDMGVVGQLPHAAGTRTPHIRWCLTGRLAFLPIHAAGPRYQSRRKPGMLDWMTSSYISTLSMLLRAQHRTETSQGGVPSPRVLAVCHSGGGGRGHLPKAKEEVEILRSCAQPETVSVILDQAARVDVVSGALRGSNWVHFACHGTQNHANPMDSALLLEDGKLPVSTLAEQNLKGEFAMLLACETAMGMPGLSDEAIHVAAALHFAGFKSVIATMWSICDDHGPIVAEKVYKHLFRKKADGLLPDALEAAYALRKAILYLRDKKKLSVRDWAPFMHFGL